jgi:hypothetical protein
VQANGNGAASGAPNDYGVVKPQGSHNFPLTTEEYRQEHSLVVEGDRYSGEPVPEPLQTFESAGFPRDILDEVALLAQRGLRAARRWPRSALACQHSFLSGRHPGAGQHPWERAQQPWSSADPRHWQSVLCVAWVG